ncbi:MAG: DUF4844 domain-containing protein [Aquabacterium sp.]
MVINALHEFRRADKLAYLPCVDVQAEQDRLSELLNTLADELVNGISKNPSKLWVLSKFQHQLEKVWQEDTEAREHFGTELETLMDILSIDSSDGLLSFYLGGL